VARGAWVLSDRFLDSSLAYQGAAVGLGIDRVRALHDFGSGGYLPARTLLFTLDPQEVEARLAARDAGGADRIGGRDAGFHAKVAAAFDRLCEEESARIRRIDASGSPEDVTSRALAALADLL
jgi:dTMP kinase